MINYWEQNALETENVYGGYVDWKERFYECPFCGEPVYECDYSQKELAQFICPVCEDCDKEE